MPRSRNPIGFAKYNRFERLIGFSLLGMPGSRSFMALRAQLSKGQMKLSLPGMST